MQHESRFLPMLLIGIGQRTLLGRGKARRALLFMLDTLKAGCIRASYRGVPYLFHMDNPTERRAVFGRYDDKELDFLLAGMDGPNSAFVDIGANSGFYSNFIFAKSGPGAIVLAVEPNPEMTARVWVNASLLSPDQKATKLLIVEQRAVSDEAGVAFLDLSIGVGAAHLVDSPQISTVGVETALLASILDKHGIEKISALKIDVEGHEARVLLPFIETAPKSLLPQRIVIEHTSAQLWRTNVINRLIQSGYRRVGKTRSNTLLAR